MRVKRTLNLSEQMKMIGEDWVTIKQNDYSLTTVRVAVHRLRKSGYQLECKQNTKKGISKVRRISNDTATV